MSKYKITSDQGAEMGTYEGESELHAVAALHRDAGYDVRVDDGELVYDSAEDKRICGDVSRLYVQEVESHRVTRDGDLDLDY